jgi:hypothetical protein
MDQPGTLIKFGKYDHLLQLQDQGLLYLNNLSHFWKIQDGMGQVYFVGICIFAKIIKRKKGYY